MTVSELSMMWNWDKMRNDKIKLETKDEVDHVDDDDEKKKPKLLRLLTNDPRSGIITLYLS